MNKQAMKNMQENDFVIQELTLYMDTHPNDTVALKYLNYHINRRPHLKAALEKEMGPLTNYDNKTENWAWIHNPWPWD